MRRLLPIWAALASILAVAAAQETPRQGLVFEKWVRDTFFDGYRAPNPTQRWDIAAAANKDHGGIPANVRAVQHGTAIDLGDALRQYEIDGSFMLILGFWEQEGDGRRLVKMIAPEITPALWRKLWGPVTYADLLRLDALVKDTGPSLEETRRRALRMKNSPPFSQAIIQVFPRIAAGQRRLQCSIPFSAVFEHLVTGTDSAPEDRPGLFGVEYPDLAGAKPRPPAQD